MACQSLHGAWLKRASTLCINWNHMGTGRQLCCAACQATGGEDEGGDEGPPQGDVSKERAALMHATSQGGSQAIEVTLLALCWCTDLALCCDRGLASAQ